MRKSRSLESRLCLLTMGLLFSLLLAFAHFQMSAQRAVILEEKKEKYESLSRMLALTYRPLTGQDNYDAYREFTSRFMERDNDVTYVMIADSRGRVLFADTRELTSRQHQNFVGYQTARFIRFIQQIALIDDSRLTKISVPAMINDSERGEVIIGFGSTSSMTAASEMESYLMFVFTLVLLVGTIGSVLLARAVTMPLKRLIDATHAVEEGDLEVTVPVSSQDEIGELSHAFNSMVSTMKETTDKLIKRANTDSLTGLYNHRYFQERLRSEIKRAERYDRPLSVVMLDLDHFKTLNDTHGHPAGDMVLQETAKALVSEGRNEIDVITRYGGEEFAVILPETELEGAMHVAERIRLAIQRHAFMGPKGGTIPVTVSLGVAMYPAHSREPEGLIMAADLAMYQSKSMGRNMTTPFDGDDKAEKTPDPYKLYLLLHASDMSTIEAMAAAVDTKGRRPQGFSKAVVAHAVLVAASLDMSEEEQNDVRIAALLHDIGKLGISETILNKTEPLTKQEMRIIRSHPSMGHSVIQKSPHLKSMLPGILSHHEWWNGGGYPSGLAGEDIPLIARIIAVVDAYHAMLTQRPHAPAKTKEQAKEEILRCSGTQFDPRIVEIFVNILEWEENQTLDRAA